MANLSWLFYKGYYNNFRFWDNDTKDEKIKKEIESFFRKKNEAFTGFKLGLNKTISYSESPSIKLVTTYPGLLIGSGYTHEIGAIGEFKLGFQLDYTTGLPVIPGSSLKGVIRSVFPDIEAIKSNENIIYKLKTDNEIDIVKAKWIIALINNIEEDNDIFHSTDYQPQANISDEESLKILKFLLAIFEGIKDHTKAESDEKYFSIFERDIFKDSFPITGNVNQNIFGTDSITPHGENPLQNPIPLLFLKILPEVTFQFNFDLKDGILSRENKLKLFKKILTVKGIGAKTNVGYGQFKTQGKTQATITTGGNVTDANSEPLLIKLDKDDYLASVVKRDPLNRNNLIFKIESEDAENGKFYSIKSPNDLNPESKVILTAMRDRKTKKVQSVSIKRIIV